MEKLKVAVIGAGPAGATAAYQLAKAGVDVTVFESSGDIGGMAKSISLWGQTVDLGPHRFFSSDRRVNRLWLELCGRDYQMVNRLTRIYYNRRFFHYPLNPSNALRNLGILKSIRCMASYLWVRLGIGPRETDCFEDWVINRFGRYLYEVFFKTYSEKLWGISCRDLDADFAAQRIKKLSLYEAVKNAFAVKKETAHKTLVDKFAYPNGGSGEIYKRMIQDVERRGGRVELNCPVKRIGPNGAGGGTVETVDGRVLAFDHIVSSMPLTKLVTNLPNVPKAIVEAADRLKFRNTILVYLNVEGAKHFRDNWLYIHAKELDVGRITNFRNWVPTLYGEQTTSILALEYWCNDDDAAWRADDSTLIEKAKREIRETELIGKSAILAGHVVRVRRCYPVYQAGYKYNLEPIVEYMRTINYVTPIGRYGAFKYNNQDHSILMGMLAADKIVYNAAHDLWSINTDYDSYQEAAVITETGLSEPVLA